MDDMNGLAHFAHKVDCLEEVHERINAEVKELEQLKGKVSLHALLTITTTKKLKFQVHQLDERMKNIEAEQKALKFICHEAGHEIDKANAFNKEVKDDIKKLQAQVFGE